MVEANASSYPLRSVLPAPGLPWASLKPLPKAMAAFIFASWRLHQEPSEVLAVSHQHISVFSLSFNRRGDCNIRINIEHCGGPQRKAPRDGRGGEWSLFHSWLHPSLCWAETDKARRVLSAAISSVMNLLYFRVWIKQEPEDIKYKATLTQNSLLFFSLFPLLENKLFM